MRILVVDANGTSLRGVVRTLLEAGYTDVQAASTGEEAWDYLQKHRVDLLIAEWKLPGLSGIELIRRVRKREMHRHGIMIMATRKEAEDVLEAVEAGADAYILKPFSNDLLLAKVVEIERKLEPSRQALR
jgi:two-component system chemotaxis response regulator CheY